MCTSVWRGMRKSLSRRAASSGIWTSNAMADKLGWSPECPQLERHVQRFPVLCCIEEQSNTASVLTRFQAAEQMPPNREAKRAIHPRWSVMAWWLTSNATWCWEQKGRQATHCKCLCRALTQPLPPHVGTQTRVLTSVLRLGRELSWNGGRNMLPVKSSRWKNTVPNLK